MSTRYLLSPESGIVFRPREDVLAMLGSCAFCGGRGRIGESCKGCGATLRFRHKRIAKTCAAPTLADVRGNSGMGAVSWMFLGLVTMVATPGFLAIVGLLGYLYSLL